MFIIKKGVVVLDYIYICVHVKVKYFQKNKSHHFPLLVMIFFTMEASDWLLVWVNYSEISKIQKTSPLVNGSTLAQRFSNFYSQSTFKTVEQHKFKIKKCWLDFDKMLFPANQKTIKIQYFLTSFNNLQSFDPTNFTKFYYF